VDNVAQIYAERLEIMDDVNNGRVPKRVPILCSCSTWAYYYKGYKPMDGIMNEEVALEVSRAIYADFYWDVTEIDPIILHHPDVYELLGGGTFTFNQDGMPQTKPGAVKVMEADEYPELIADPYKYLLEKVLPRRYKLFSQELDFETKYESLLKYFSFQKEIGRKKMLHDQMAQQEFGMPNAVQGMLIAPVDYILDSLRDFHGIMQDIKRRPELVREAGMALIDYSLASVANIEPEKGKTVLIPMHLPTFISPRDFEKVYWPSYQALINDLVEKGFTVKCAFERKYEHLFDYLQELPQNKIVAVVEDDDIRLFKEKLGDRMAIQGGMPTQTLYYGTKEECLDLAKGLIDDLAPGGGYIFSTNRAMIAVTDGNPENLQAVNEFVREYAVYK